MLTSQELYEKNELLAYKVVHKMKIEITGFGLEDLFQTAKLGLWKACTTYDPKRSKFSTWAVNCIRNELLMAYRSASKHKGVEVLSLDALADWREGSAHFEPSSESFEDSLLGLVDAENLDLSDEEKQTLDLKRYLTESEVEKLCEHSKWQQRKIRMKARGQAV
jgi:RNA polymerase sigma factor (sigma-70 family)